MARKGFTSEFRQFYNRQKRKGFSDRAIAEELNISPSWFAAVKAGRGSFGRQSTSRIEAATTSSYDEGGGSDLYTITGDELRRLLASGNTRTARDARNAFADIQSQNPDLTISDLDEGMSFPRPEVWRTYKGQRVKVYLGRTKQDEQRLAVLRNLQARGVDTEGFNEWYDEALEGSEG